MSLLIKELRNRVSKLEYMIHQAVKHKAISNKLLAESIIELCQVLSKVLEALSDLRDKDIELEERVQDLLSAVYELSDKMEQMLNELGERQ